MNENLCKLPTVTVLEKQPQAQTLRKERTLPVLLTVPYNCPLLESHIQGECVEIERLKRKKDVVNLQQYLSKRVL